MSNESLDAERNHSAGGANPPCPPDAPLAELARGAEAVRRVRPNTRDYPAEFESLIGYAEKHGFFEHPLIHSPSDAHGHEHEVWFADDSTRVIKATYPNKFGLTLGSERNATPIQYLRRLALQNRVFGDDIIFEGVANDGGRLRIITSQPAIRGETPTGAEVEALFCTLGFIPVQIGDDWFWYRSADASCAFDAHVRNFVKTSTGTLAPIDVNMIEAEGEVREAIEAALNAVR